MNPERDPPSWERRRDRIGVRAQLSGKRSRMLFGGVGSETLVVDHSDLVRRLDDEVCHPQELSTGRKATTDRPLGTNASMLSEPGRYPPPEAARRLDSVLQLQVISDAIASQQPLEEFLRDLAAACWNDRNRGGCESRCGDSGSSLGPAAEHGSPLTTHRLDVHFSDVDRRQIFARASKTKTMSSCSPSNT